MPAHGEGITFWPLAEAVRSAAAIAEDDLVDVARAKVVALAGGDAGVADRVASAIGLVPTVYAVEETFWGVRRLFEILAADRPLVVVIEDLHWAEPTLLELVEDLVERVRRPCVLVCTARPELLDRPDAPSEGDRRVRIGLDRLGPGDATAMAERLLAGRQVDVATVGRIVSASDGNPLFMEQMAAMLDDADPGTELDVPPSHRASGGDRVGRPRESHRDRGRMCGCRRRAPEGDEHDQEER
jgi:predicted ATPase